MKVKETESGFFVVLDRGEKVIECLRELAQSKNIGSGTIQGIGALMNAELGFYHLHSKKYDERLFADEMELVNLSGNFSWFGGKPVIHCHVTLGDTEFRAIAGHLFEAEVAVTVEIFVNPRPTRIERKFVPEVGLNLQNF